MEERDLRLLEHVAIRNITTMDYKVWNELQLTGAMFRNDYPVLSELSRILKDKNKYMLSERTVIRLEDAVNNVDKVKKAVDDYIYVMERSDIKVVSRSDYHYPKNWSELSGMPPVFFAKGNLGVLDEVTYNGAAAIVGSRDPGRYSLYATKEFAQKLARKHVVIVSGLALGIDRKAHETCLDSGGATVAIVPGGIDIVYPYQNRDIYDRICENGLLVSEMPPGQPVIKQYFPSRNRLISALSDVCLIMEAGMFSGTLHTASFAASQGKDVFVLPNSIYCKNSIGGLMLLRDGAEVLIDEDAVLDRIYNAVNNRRMEIEASMDNAVYRGELEIEGLRELAKEHPDELDESDWKHIVCDEISERPKNIDEICTSLGIPFSFLSALITNLETDGKIANEKGKYVLTIHGR